MTDSRPAFLQRPAVVINRRSGTAVRLSSEKCAGLVREMFERYGAAVEMREVEPDELGDALKEASKREPSALIVGGGDGTVLAGAEVAREKGIPLGILPLGTFNHAARDLNLPLELEDSIEAIASGHIEEIDMGIVNGKQFLCVCVLGFYSEYARKGDAVRSARWWTKLFRRMMASLSSFSSYPLLDLNLKMGSEEKQVRSRFVAVSNNPYSGTKGVMLQKEAMDTGQLGIYISTHRSLERVAGTSFAFLSGNLEEDPDILTYQAEKVEISCGMKTLKILLDGEVVKESTPLRFSIEHKAIEVIVPPIES